MEQTIKRRTTKEVYVPQGVPTKITATSRLSVKLCDDFYTFECVEERTFPEIAKDINLEKEWEAIFNSVNKIVDKQYKKAVEAVFGKETKKSSTTKKRTGQ